MRGPLQRTALYRDDGSASQFPSSCSTVSSTLIVSAAAGSSIQSRHGDHSGVFNAFGQFCKPGCSNSAIIWFWSWGCFLFFSLLLPNPPPPNPKVLLRVTLIQKQFSSSYLPCSDSYPAMNNEDDWCILKSFFVIVTLIGQKWFLSAVHERTLSFQREV